MKNAKRPCLWPGCPALVERGYCTQHQPQEAARAPQAAPRVKRPDPFYLSQAWKEIRARHLAAEPQCRICERPGSHVDHIVPRSRGGSDADSNLQTLCWKHHSQKTATQDGAFGNRPRDTVNPDGSITPGVS